MTSHGEYVVRGASQVSRSPINEGRFGRIFRRLPAMPDPGDDALVQLAAGMQEDQPPPAGGWASSPQLQDFDNPAIPAGYTYLGQFIDHDITFDPTSSLSKQNDPDALVDFRSPRYDLDSLYGSGPDDEPFQYDPGTEPRRLLIGHNLSGDEDLPRNERGTALIGDPRNDENIIVSQLQLLFLKFHNKLAQQVADDPAIPTEEKFAETQRRVRWHYQLMIVQDYLPRIVGQDLIDRMYVIGDDGVPDIKLRHYRVKNNPYMPIEFSAAAFRFGHSMIRGVYDLSDAVPGRPIFLPGEVGEFDDLRGFRPLPQSWTIEWKHFFPLEGADPQPSRKIDTKLAPGLFTLPAGGGSLPELNLRRGRSMGLPSGQDLARFLGIAPLTPDELGGTIDPTPLWFYILKESEVRAGGAHLGEVGGRIVAEVLLGLLNVDKTSFINMDPTWQPTIPVAGEQLTMADIITFVMS